MVPIKEVKTEPIETEDGCAEGTDDAGWLSQKLCQDSKTKQKQEQDPKQHEK